MFFVSFQNVAALVMTIFSALAAAILLGFEITGAVYGASNYYLESQRNWVSILFLLFYLWCKQKCILDSK